MRNLIMPAMRLFTPRRSVDGIIASFQRTIAALDAHTDDLDKDNHRRLAAINKHRDAIDNNAAEWKRAVRVSDALRALLA